MIPVWIQYQKYVSQISYCGEYRKQCIAIQIISQPCVSLHPYIKFQTDDWSWNEKPIPNTNMRVVYQWRDRYNGGMMDGCHWRDIFYQGCRARNFKICKICGLAKSHLNSPDEKRWWNDGHLKEEDTHLKWHDDTRCKKFCVRAQSCHSHISVEWGYLVSFLGKSVKMTPHPVDNEWVLMKNVFDLNIAWLGQNCGNVMRHFHNWNDFLIAVCHFMKDLYNNLL